MKTSLAIGLSLCVVACAHREPKEHTTVSAVGNEDVTHDARDPDNKKMHYTTVSNEDALNHDRAHEEHEAMHGQLNRGDVPAASLPSAAATGAPASSAPGEPEKCGLNVYFGTASAELTAQTKQQLDAVATCMKRPHAPDDAVIVGSADPRGPESDNAALAEERARRVSRYLKELGVPEGEIRIRSVGEGRASAAPDTYPASRKVQVKTQ
jgi:outer membrane protein OmpA-like peptidoglycan-associated protein